MGAAALLLGLAAGPGAAAPTTASFPRGSWSVGLQGGYALVDMGDVNRILEGLNASAGTRYDPLEHAWEGVLDVRYAFHDRFFAGIEGGYLRGRTRDGTGARGPVEASAIPLALTAGGTIGRPDRAAVRIVAGVGLLLDASLDPPGAGGFSGTGYSVCLGGEVEYRLAPAWAVTSQALARTAKAIEPGGLTYDLDFTGASFRAGVRGYLGRRPR